MNLPENRNKDPLPEPLSSVVAQIAGAKPDAEEITAVVEALKQRAPTADVELARPLQSTRRKSLFAFGAAAAAMLLIVTIGLLPPANALELLADALASKPCIKMTSTYEGTTQESWIMPAARQSANRSEEWIEFFDANSETVVTHNRKTGELVRSVRFESEFEFGSVRDLVNAIIASGTGDTPETIRGVDVVSSQVKTIDGKKVLTLELNPTSMAGVAADATATATISIDPATELPMQCVMTLRNNGSTQTVTERWSYPEEGPADIFALGVDPATKLIDRVPSTSVKPLLAGIYAGRVKFDDYVAVTIRARKENVTANDNFDDITLAAKQGGKFLLARIPWSKFRGMTREAAAKEILADPDKFDWNAMTIVDDKMHHHLTSKGVVTVEINLPPEEFIVPMWNSIPHFVGRPPLGIGNADVSAAIATEAEGGPEGCVLLQTLTTPGMSPRAAVDPDVERKTSRISKGGYWVRADRDYLVMRADSQFENNRRHGFVLDSLAQSPKGCWYPITAHRPSDKAGQNEISASYYSYHVDFEQQLPEKMFDPSYYK